MKSSVERTGRIAPLLVIVSLAAAALVASNADPAPAEATAQRCAQYAQREVQQYQLYKSHPQCQANTTSMAWSGNYEDAYNGCLKVPAAMAKFVEGRRESHLQSCGALGGASGGAAPANGGHAGNYLGTGGSGPSGGAGNNSGSGNSGSSGSRPANSGSGHSSSGASGPGAPAGTAANGSSQSSGAPPQGLPPRMHFCGISHCGTLTWNSGHYDAIFDDTQAWA
jgi:hypothetical protein